MDSYSPEFESKRVAFRKYLESEGFVDALEGALEKLYGEKEKPEDAVLYVRQWLCETCQTEEQYEQMKQDLRDAYKSVASLEKEVEYEKNNIIPTPEEIEQQLLDAYKCLQEDTVNPPSLLKKYLTPEFIESFKDKESQQEPTTRLWHCIQAGSEHHEDPIGIYGANAECYAMFGDLFTPIVKDYHGKTEAKGGKNKALQPKPDYGDPSQVSNLDPKKKFITNVVIYFTRNVIGFPLLPRIPYDNCMALEQRMIKGLGSLEGEFSGNYTSLIDIDLDVQQEMADRKILFRRDDPFFEAAGGYHYYPYGRGVFLNEKETFGVWVNALDHITVFAKENSGALGKAYKRVVEGVDVVEKACKLKFYNHKNFGFISPTVKNLGTGMKVSADIRLPNLKNHVEYLEIMANDLGIKIKGIPPDDCDKSPKDPNDTTLTISNKNTLGTTQIAIVITMEEALNQLINTELSLAKGGKLQTK